MAIETFYIRSLLVQNLIMGSVLAVLAGLLTRFVRQHKKPHTTAVSIWLLVVLCFFNSPLWGFSAVSVSGQGIKLHYGFLSIFKNIELPPDTPWKIYPYMTGIRRMKKLYYLHLAGHDSLKITAKRITVLQSTGKAIDDINGRPMGSQEERPVNL